MKKAALFLGFLVLFLFVPSQPAWAADQCGGTHSGVNGITIPTGASSHTIIIDISQYSGQDIEISAWKDAFFQSRLTTPTIRVGQNGGPWEDIRNRTLWTSAPGGGTVVVQGGRVIWTIKDPGWLREGHDISVDLRAPGSLHVRALPICVFGGYKTVNSADANQSQVQNCQVRVWQERNGQKCYLSGNGCMSSGGVTTFVSLSGLVEDDGSPYDGKYLGINASGSRFFTPNASNGSVTFSFASPRAQDVSIEFLGYLAGRSEATNICQTINFPLQEPTLCSSICSDDTGSITGESSAVNFRVCLQARRQEDINACAKCVGGDNGENPLGMWTAIGCIPIEPEGIVSTLVKIGLGIGGGITLLLILAGAFRLSTASGDPKQADEAKEQITSAVIGLLFIIFSVTILRFIGVQFLQIPGLGG